MAHIYIYHSEFHVADPLVGLYEYYYHCWQKYIANCDE